MAGNRQRSTHWCFTHHVHEDCNEHPYQLETVRTRKSSYKVIGGACQLEVTKTGGQHWQGWCHFDKEIILETLKDLFCDKIHWEKMKGTVADNMAYVTKVRNKDGTIARANPESEPIVFGDIEAQNPHLKAGTGARNDLEAVIDLCNEGNNLKDIATTCPNEWIKFHKGISSYHEMVKPNWVEQPREFIILWGDAGSGKDWKAKQIIGEDSFYKPEKNNQSHYSFETYDGQKWIYLEEFKGLGLFIDDLKTMTDRYECILRGRGCSKLGLHTGVIITSQENPSTWFPLCSDEDQAALLRRLTGLVHCRKAHWLDQLSGELHPNPCPYVAQGPQRARTFQELPIAPERAGDAVIHLNGKRRRLNDEFIDLR